jgi:CRISPR-associated protein Cmr4
MKQTRILYLFTRTPLHVGAGSSVGAIDQPIVRERHTGFPIIPGSSIKGVLADGFLDREDDGKLKKDDKGRALRSDVGRELFGRQDHESDAEGHRLAGGISFGEAKLLAFPVRSARGCFAWLVSPLTLRRWQRDAGKTGLPDLPSPERQQACFDAACLGHEKQALFEDYVFAQHPESIPTGWLEALEQLQPEGESVWRKLCRQHLALVSDETLSLFAQTACEVAQHVKIDDERGTACDGALFNQENVPAETLFYAALTELRTGALPKLSVPPALQIGGDGSTGLGFVSTQLV